MGFVFGGLAEPPVPLGAPGDPRSPAPRYVSTALSLADGPLLGDVAVVGGFATREPVEPACQQAVPEALVCGLAFLFRFHVDQELDWAAR